VKTNTENRLPNVSMGCVEVHNTHALSTFENKTTKYGSPKMIEAQNKTNSQESVSASTTSEIMKLKNALQKDDETECGQSQAGVSKIDILRSSFAHTQQRGKLQIA